MSEILHHLTYPKSPSDNSIGYDMAMNEIILDLCGYSYCIFCNSFDAVYSDFNIDDEICSICNDCFAEKINYDDILGYDSDQDMWKFRKN